MYHVVLNESRKMFNNSIKPIINVECCEICNKTNNLHVHHNEPLSISVRKVLKEFDIDDTNVLVDLVSARSLRAGFTIVCSKCHKELHKGNAGDLVSYGMNVETLREKKEKEEKLQELNIYLESIVGKRLYKEEKEELIDKLNLKDKRGRIQRSYTSLEEYLKSKMNYSLSKKINYSNKNDDKYRKTYWTVQRL